LQNENNWSQKWKKEGKNGNLRKERVSKKHWKKDFELKQVNNFVIKWWN
jgi:hypothetical protein